MSDIKTQAEGRMIIQGRQGSNTNHSMASHPKVRVDDRKKSKGCNKCIIV